MLNTNQSQVATEGLSPTLAINQLSKELLAEGKEVFRFGFGESPFPSPNHVGAALQQNADKKSYLPTQGLPALRESVATYYSQKTKLNFSADQVMIGPGSKELIFTSQMAQYATLLLPSPSWVSYEPQAKMLNRKVDWIPTTAENGYCLQATQLQAYCQANPSTSKLLILNYPNNPVGSTYSAAELQALAEVAKENSIIIISDEIYGDLEHNNEHLSIADFYPEGTIISSGLSKWCGAGGWRLGVFLIPKALRRLQNRMLQIASETFSCVNAPIQYAAIEAYQDNPATQSYLANSRLILKKIASEVYTQLSKNGISMPAPQGGFYLFPNFAKFEKALAARNITTSTDLCDALLRETGVALLPGVAFGRPSTELTARLAYVDFDGGKALNWCESIGTENLNPTFFNTCAPKIVKGVARINEWTNKL